MNHSNPLFDFCVPTPHINHHRNVKLIFHALISSILTLRCEHNVFCEVPKTKDFYISCFCNFTTHSTWHDTSIMMSGYRGSRCLFSETYQSDFAFAETVPKAHSYLYMAGNRAFFRNRLNLDF